MIGGKSKMVEHVALSPSHKDPIGQDFLTIQYQSDFESHWVC